MSQYILVDFKSYNEEVDDDIYVGAVLRIEAKSLKEPEFKALRDELESNEHFTISQMGGSPNAGNAYIFGAFDGSYGEALAELKRLEGAGYTWA